MELSEADKIPVPVVFNPVETLVNQGRLPRETARRLIEIELRKALSDSDREYLLALRRVIGRA